MSGQVQPTRLAPISAGLGITIRIQPPLTVAEPTRRPTPLCWGYPDREHGMDVVWETYRVGADEGVWEPTSYNVRADDGQSMEAVAG